MVTFAAMANLEPILAVAAKLAAPFDVTTMLAEVVEAARQQIPVILSLNISMFKDTALVSTIAVGDLMFQANTVTTETYRALELFTTAALVYFCIAFPVSLFTSYLERRGQLARTGRLPGLLRMEDVLHERVLSLLPEVAKTRIADFSQLNALIARARANESARAKAIALQHG